MVKKDSGLKSMYIMLVVMLVLGIALGVVIATHVDFEVSTPKASVVPILSEVSVKIEKPKIVVEDPGGFIGEIPAPEQTDEPTVDVIEKASVDIMSLTEDDIYELLYDMQDDGILDDLVSFKEYWQGDLGYVIGDLELIPGTNAMYVKMFLDGTDVAVDCIYRDGEWICGYFENVFDPDFPIVQFFGYKPELSYEFYEYVYNNMSSRFIYTECSWETPIIELQGLDKDETLMLNLANYTSEFHMGGAL